MCWLRQLHHCNRAPEVDRHPSWILFYVLSLIIVSIHLLLPGLMHAYDWEAIGPQGGTPKRFVLPPTSSDYDQLGATMRTLFGRKDTGEWVPISPEYGNFATWTINDVTVAQSDPDHIYLLRTGPYTGTSIFRTLDGGYSWDTIGLPVDPTLHYVYCVVVHPQISDTVLAGSFTSVFLSDDAGDTWVDTGVSPPDEPITTDLLIRPDTTSIILMGSRGDDPGIYLSPDRGESWDHVFEDDHIDQLLLSPENPLVLYARTIAQSELDTVRLFRSMDGGAGWALWSSAPHLSTNLVIDPNDSRKMYILGTDEEGARTRVLASVDSGSTWSVITTTGEVKTSSFMSLGIAPGTGGEPAILYLGTNFYGTFRSTDDGASWESERFYSAYIGAVATDIHTPGRVYAGTAPALNQSLANGRLFVSEDEGSTWSYIGESDDDDHVIGRIWAIQPSVHQANRVWVGTSYGLFLSNNAGRLLTHIRDAAVRSIWEDPTDPEHVVIGTSWVPTLPMIPPRLMETTDGGSSWEVLREFDHAVMDIEVDASDNRIYCALGALTVSGLSSAGAGGLEVWDEGAGWTEVVDLSDHHVSGVLLDHYNPDRLYVSTLDQGVLTSSDRGLSWITMNSGLADTEVHALEVLSLSGEEVDLIAGTWQGTYRWTTDHWISLSEGMIMFPSGGDSVSLHTTALKFDTLTDKLYTGTAGRSTFMLDGLTPTGDIDADTDMPTGIPKSFTLYQNYPNPFNPTTTIPFDIPGEGGTREHVLLTISDLRGKRLMRLIDSELEPGRHRVVWNGRNKAGEHVSSGIYLYTLRSDDTVFTRKMLLLK